MPRAIRFFGLSSLWAALAIAPGCGGSPATVAPAPPGGPPPGLQDAIDAAARAVVDPSGASGKSVGLVIGVVTPELQIVSGYGLTKIGGDTTPGPDTIFEIGSITKVFTGALLAEATLRGGVSLGDEVSRFLPDGVSVPAYGSRAITLLDLATHTSGLPTMPDNLRGRPPNPGAGYTPELLYAFLNGYQLTTEPGTSYTYSNLGVGLLGRALLLYQRAPSYDAMIDGLMGARLGMHDTHIERRVEDQHRMATGHRGAAVMPPGQIDTLEGAGALRSTGDDMIRFLRAGLGLDAAIEDVLAIVEVPRRDSPHGQTGLALEVRADEALGPIYEKGGGMPGFSAFVLYAKGPAIGVVVLANSTGFAARTLADEVLRLGATIGRRP